MAFNPDKGGDVSFPPVPHGFRVTLIVENTNPGPKSKQSGARKKSKRRK